MLRDVALDELLLRVIAKELVENVVRERLLIPHKDFESKSHSVERCRFPDELNCEFELRFKGHTLAVFKFELNLFVDYPHDVASALPFDLTISILIEEL